MAQPIGVDAPRADEIEISLFGPGFGEALAVHLGSGEWLIVDSCIDEPDRTPTHLQYLERIGVDVSSSVKLIVITHFDDDHIRGISHCVERCQSATVVLPGAINRRDALRHIQASADPTSQNGSGLDEIRSVLSFTHQRKSPVPIFAKARTCLLGPQGDALASVWALSPSDHAYDAGLTWLSNELEHGAPLGRQVPAPASRNMGSVALWVRVGQVTVVLGADLVASPSRQKGWLSVVDWHPFGATASAVKVPHHGSAGSHSDEMWSKMTTGSPTSLVSPFVRGSVALPEEQDLRRIRDLSEAVYLTAEPVLVRRRKGTLPNDVARAVGKRKLVGHNPAGHVRIRKSLDDARGPWKVELARGAYQFY